MPKDLIFGPSEPTGLCGCLVDWLGCLFKPGLMVCSYNLRDRCSLASLAKPGEGDIMFQKIRLRVVEEDT